MPRGTRSIAPLALALTLALTLATGATAQSPSNPTLWVANGQDDTLTAIDSATGANLATVPVGSNPHVLNISPDGGYLYVINAGGHDRATNPTVSAATAANSLWVLATNDGAVVAKIPVGNGPTHPIPSPDGKRVYVSNTDANSVSVIDTATWTVIRTLTNIPEPHAGALTQDGRTLLLAAAGNDTLTAIDTTTLTINHAYPVGAKARGLATSGTGNHATAYVTNKADGTLSIIHLASGTVTTVPVGAGAHGIRIAPDGATLYIALAGKNAVAELDAATGTTLRTIQVGTKPEQLDLTPDGHTLAVSNTGDNTVTLIDATQQRVLRTVPSGRGNFGVQFARPYLPANP